MNGGATGFPEYHNVYIHPPAYAIYKETRGFPEGTILLQELQLTQEAQEEDGSRTVVSGRGNFPCAFNGIDISVKDPMRFEESGNWGTSTLATTRRPTHKPLLRHPSGPVGNAISTTRTRTRCSPGLTRFWMRNNHARGCLEKGKASWWRWQTPAFSTYRASSS